MKDKFTYTLIFKLLKIKDSKKTLKAAREKRHRGTKIQITTDSSSETVEAGRHRVTSIKLIEEEKKTANQGSISSENIFQIVRQIKTFSF